MGEVFRARETRLHRDVAVKILDFGLAKLKAGTTCRSSSEAGDARQRVPTLVEVSTIRIDPDSIINSRT